MKDFYHTLEVSQSSSQEEIKKAYRKMARKWHPDTNMGDKNAEAKFKEVSEAYETLKDVQKRKNYDLSSKKNKKNFNNPLDNEKTSEKSDGGSQNQENNGKNSVEYRFFSMLVTIFSVSLMLVLFFLIAARNKDHPAMEKVVKVFDKIDKEKVKNAFDKFGELHLTAENLFKETTEVDNPFKLVNEDKKEVLSPLEKTVENDGNPDREEVRVKIELLEDTKVKLKQKPKAQIIYTKGATISGKDADMVK